MTLKDLLLYLTNNQKESKHEHIFDIIFLLVNSAALVVGAWLFWHFQEPQWIAVLVIEYTWALDNMRHNRP